MLYSLWLFNIHIINFSKIRRKKNNTAKNRSRFQFVKYHNNGNGFELDIITRLEHTRGSHSLTVDTDEFGQTYCVLFHILPLPDKISQKLYNNSVRL